MESPASATTRWNVWTDTLAPAPSAVVPENLSQAPDRALTAADEIASGEMPASLNEVTDETQSFSWWETTTAWGLPTIDAQAGRGEDPVSAEAIATDSALEEPEPESAVVAKYPARPESLADVLKENTMQLVWEPAEVNADDTQAAITGIRQPHRYGRYVPHHRAEKISDRKLVLKVAAALAVLAVSAGAMHYMARDTTPIKAETTTDETLSLDKKTTPHQQTPEPTKPPRVPVAYKREKIPSTNEYRRVPVYADTKIDAIKAKIAAYAWPNYCRSSADDCKGYDDPSQMRPAYKKSVVGAKNRGEYVGSCKGVDCGEFVMRVMRDSGADPQYNKYEGNTLDQLHYLEDFSDDDHKKGNQVRYHHIKAGEKLQPGDIAIRNKGRGLHHTFFYVGNNMYGIDDNKNVTSFNNVVASASECGRAPMASSLMRRTLFQWYRIIDPKAPVKK